MTRINCIDPQLLHDKHLLAEYRELPRIFNLVKKALSKGVVLSHEPNDSYKLGPGHIRFFYTRCGYLLKRQQRIVKECLNRGMSINFTDPNTLVSDIPDNCMHDWVPDYEAIKLNLDRINERLSAMKQKDTNG